MTSGEVNLMKKFLFPFAILILLITWMPTSAEAAAPTVTITIPAGPHKDAFNATITFSEAVTGFIQSDITLNPLASVTGFTGSGSTYTATITPIPGQQGSLTIEVAANVAQNASSEGNQAGSATVEVDAQRPRCTIETSTDPIQPRGSFIWKVIFPEPGITGFTAEDVTLTNGASVTKIELLNLPGFESVSVYKIFIKPKVTGDVTISVAANVATDAAGNSNTAADSRTVFVDLPHQIMVMEPDEDGPHNEAFEVMVMFTESVGAFVANDITLTPSTMATVTDVTGSAPTYTVEITPADNQDGELSIQIEANAVQDNASTPMNYPASNTITVDIDTERPEVSEITGPSGAQNGNFDVTITFDGPVHSFDASDLSVSGGASAPSRWSSGDDGDTSYTGTIDISDVSAGNSTDVTISVGSNVAEDAAGNGSVASASSVDLTVTVDNQKPTPTIGAVSGTKSDDFTISITFDESVTDFTKSDISLAKQSGTAGGTVSSVTGSGTTYSATITPSGEGTLRISIPAGGADDDAGNTSRASANVDVTVDTEGPTPTITATSPQNGAFNATIDFGETVTGFVKADVTVGGTATHTVGALSGGTNGSYTLRITPTTSGTITIDVAANVATDDGGNSNLAATQATVDVDTDAPTPTITVPTTPQNGAFDVMIDFGESVTGFTATDLITSGLPGSKVLKSGTNGSRHYTVTVTPAGIPRTVEVILYVSAGRVTDAAGNNNLRSELVTLKVDTVRPTVSISDVPSVDQKDAFDLTITFSEDVEGFATDDLTVTGEATATAVAAVGTSKQEYTATITPNAGKEGNVKVKVNADAATDTAGNANTASSATGNIRIDTIAPTPTITAPTTPQNGVFNVTIDFGETVTGFVKADVTVGGTATHTVGALSGGTNGSYTLRITPTTSGTITIDVAANVATDSAGNSNLAATRASVTTDTVAPTPTITGPTTPQNGPFDVTVDFDEDVTGFEPGELLVIGTTDSSNWKSGANGPRRYTRTITPAAGIAVSTGVVHAGAATDAAGNGNVRSNIISFSIDTVRPTVSISDVPSGDQKDPFDLTITFSEDVEGFATGDLTVTGEATATAVAAVGTSKKEYTATITPNAAKER